MKDVQEFSRALDMIEAFELNYYDHVVMEGIAITGEKRRELAKALITEGGLGDQEKSEEIIFAAIESMKTEPKPDLPPYLFS